MPLWDSSNPIRLSLEAGWHYYEIRHPASDQEKAQREGEGEEEVEESDDASEEKEASV